MQTSKNKKDRKNTYNVSKKRPDNIQTRTRPKKMKKIKKAQKANHINHTKHPVVKGISTPDTIQTADARVSRRD